MVQRVPGGPGSGPLERRQTQMSRHLSTFLADASLALNASDSLGGLLRLVDEQARELVTPSAACDGRRAAAQGLRKQPLLPGRQALDGVRAVARPVRDIPGDPSGRRLREERRRGTRCLACIPHHGRQSTAQGVASRSADRPRRQRARRHPALRQARRILHRERRGRSSSIPPRWRRPPVERARLHQEHG